MRAKASTQPVPARGKPAGLRSADSASGTPPAGQRRRGNQVISNQAPGRPAAAKQHAAKPRSKKSKQQRSQRARNAAPSARYLAVLALHDVLSHDLVLDHAIDKNLGSLHARDRAFAQHLVYMVLRRLNSLQAISSVLLEKPLPRKYADIQQLLLLGLLQLWDSHVADHAAISATVNVCDELGKNWARKLINAALRRFQREQEEIIKHSQCGDDLLYSTPQWLLLKLQQDWPNRWLSIVQQGLRPAPLWLRVNLQKSSRNDYLRMLSEHHIAAAAGNVVADIQLREPVAVEQLPGFAEGLVSVQDSSAQFAAMLLRPEPRHRVLDLCAAPGGKSCQLLEQFAGIELTCVDNQPQRLERLHSNLKRLGLHCQVLRGDARASLTPPDTTTGEENWWDGKLYDCILLDAPCSASGVIRRHPDIKWRLQEHKLTAILALQQQLLEAAWCMLKPDGRLLYSTCSVLKFENDEQLRQFMDNHKDARMINPTLPVGQATASGWQILPGDGGGDGMYFGLLEKSASQKNGQGNSE